MSKLTQKIKKPFHPEFFKKTYKRACGMKNYPYPYPIKWCGDVFRTSVGKNKHLDKHADNTENVCLQLPTYFNFSFLNLGFLILKTKKMYVFSFPRIIQFLSVDFGLKMKIYLFRHD